jgi:NAD(P)H dehydrogenase (quinone)
MTSLPTLFVAGAGGKMGHRVVELLLERGYAGKLIAGSRHPEKLDFPGVETRKADYGDLAGFTEALKGIDRLLIISVDVLGEERERLQGSAVAAAKAAGVKHIVYTSMPDPEPGNPTPMAPGHYFTEQAIKASGIPYTILRMSWYAENLLGSLPSAIASGKWFTSSGEGMVSHVTREDTARAAAGALLSDHVGSRVVTVSGPAALSTANLAAIASEVTGRSIEVVNLSDGDYTVGLKHAGFPEGLPELFTTFEVLQRQGGLSMVTNAVEELWGTKPTDVRSFLLANKQALLQAA